MRVAFGLMGGVYWTGGVNYLINLISALAERRSIGVTPVLMIGSDADPEQVEPLARLLPSSPVVSSTWNRNVAMRLARAMCSHGIQRDLPAELALRRARVDVVFQHSSWLGATFGLPTLAWIADLQHRRHPDMFSRLDRFRRDVGYAALSRFASRLMVSSEDARGDCEMFFPASRGRVDAVPFAVRHQLGFDDGQLGEVRDLYRLPDRFVFLPNQLWRHKNHLGVLAALKLLADRGEDATVVACGNPRDYRHPGHPIQVMAQIEALGIQDRFRFLGMIPGRHILPLMRLSCAVLNPSFHEGWSTTVEEAKALGVPLLLSDIPIHREQAEGLNTRFFDPWVPAEIAESLVSAALSFAPGPRPESEMRAAELNELRRERFAMRFAAAAERTLSKTS